MTGEQSNLILSNVLYGGLQERYLSRHFTKYHA